MARRKTVAKQKKTRRGRGKRILPAFLLAFLTIGTFFGWMHLNACLTRLCYADVYIEDLPASFNGVRILYLSDLNIRSRSEAKSCARIMNKLRQLEADILLLGGDYSADSTLNKLTGGEISESEIYAVEFIDTLADFPAPLGKFAISGEEDNPVTAAAFEAAGVQYLQNECGFVEKGGSKLMIAGLGSGSSERIPYEQIGGYFHQDDCVIVLAHNPSSYVGVRVAEAKDGGAWADLILSGHTLGGQIRFFGRNIRSLSEEEERCLSGWHYTDDLPMLVSQGLGCKDVKLRFGSRSEIWCLTLRCPSESQVLPKL